MTGTWSGGWATGDIVLAAEFAKGVGCISDTTLGVGAASIDVTGIIGGYAHLLVVAYLRSTTAALTTDLIIRFNGDSGSNYTGNGTTSATSITSANTDMPGASGTSGNFGAYGILIPNYASTTANKPVVMFGNHFDSGSTAMQVGECGGGQWRNTSAIDQVTISAAAGSLDTGSRVSVYVMGS